MNALIFDLREQAERLEEAARRLELQDSWHMEHAALLVRLAQDGVGRIGRKIERLQISRVHPNRLTTR